MRRTARRRRRRRQRRRRSTTALRAVAVGTAAAAAAVRWQPWRGDTERERSSLVSVVVCVRPCVCVGRQSSPSSNEIFPPSRTIFRTERRRTYSDTAVVPTLARARGAIDCSRIVGCPWSLVVVQHVGVAVRRRESARACTRDEWSTVLHVRCTRRVKSERYYY